MILINFAVAFLIGFAFYQVVRQDERLDKARGSVRFLLILFIAEQLAYLLSQIL